jgi:hypothetical protein
MLPEVGRSSLKIILISDDLPEPEAPTRKTNSPLSISIEILSSAARGAPRYALVTWEIEIIRFLA